MQAETHEQRIVVDWCRCYGVGIFSVPNGAKITGPWKFAHIAKLKKEGLLRGAPDLVLIDRSPNTGNPVAIEMKTAKGRVSKAQQTVIDAMRTAGWTVIVAHGAHEAIAALMNLGYVRKPAFKAVKQ